MSEGPKAAASQGRTPEDDKIFWRAIACACGLYVVYGALRASVPGIGEVLGFALIVGFYFLPRLMLKQRPDLAEAWQVGPDVPMPKWEWRAAKVAGVAALVVFPAFCVGTWWFYGRVCAGDMGVLAPVIAVEEMTPWSGKLEGFMRRMCVDHKGGMWPHGIWLPEEWTRWYGLGFVYTVAIGVFAIALPEEVFHRGYLMSALERRWTPRFKVLGTPFGLAAVVSSAIFALGHLVGMAQTARLGTFFPALVFAYLWRRSGSLWAPALFHVASNLLMDLLLASTFPGR